MVKIKNIEKAAERITKASERKEKIVLHGDADLDGIASVVILKETLEEIGFNSYLIYFPDRGGGEGYGLSFEAIEYLKEKIRENFLLIVLDSGITSFDQIKKAQESGIEVVVVDHHQPLIKLPEASLIVDPKQKGDEYPFKNLANAGIAFKLAEEILGEKMSEEKKNSFFELTALATISDMMEQTEDNEYFIEKGLKSLEKTKRKGLMALRKFFGKEMSTKEVAQKMISLINIGEIIDHKIEGYNLLVCEDEKEAEKLVEKLAFKNEEKRFKINEIIKEIESKPSFSENIIFEYSDKWDTSFLGAVASKICQKTNKSVFLIKKGKEESRGAIRTADNVNAVDVMSKYSDLLESFGGHPPAAGFNIKNENIEKFKQKLIEYFNKLS